MQQLLLDDCVPYADFAVWGPHQRRLYKKLVFTTFTHMPNGEWVHKELPGPPDVDAWWRSWRVYKCVLLLLGAVRPERLDNYGEHIRDLVNRYGAPAWWAVYQGDVRCRSEHFERLRRRCEEAHVNAQALGAPSAYNQAKPWDDVFAAAVRDREFWDREVRDPAVVFSIRVIVAKDLTDQCVPGPAWPGARRPPRHRAGSHLPLRFLKPVPGARDWRGKGAH